MSACCASQTPSLYDALDDRSSLLLAMRGDPFAWATALVVLALLWYWSFRSRGASRVSAERSGHSQIIRAVLYTLLPALVVLLVLQLLGVIRAALPVPAPTLSVLRTVGFPMFLLGTVVAIWARESLGIHWAHAADFQILPGQDLVTDGPYRYVRHPLYLSLLLVFLGTELIVGSMFLVLIIPLWWLLLWQSRKEEEILRAAFRSPYRDYERTTGMFFPRILGRRQ